MCDISFIFTLVQWNAPYHGEGNPMEINETTKINSFFTKSEIKGVKSNSRSKSSDVSGNSYAFCLITFRCKIFVYCYRLFKSLFRTVYYHKKLLFLKSAEKGMHPWWCTPLTLQD